MHHEDMMDNVISQNGAWWRHDDLMTLKMFLSMSHATVPKLNQIDYGTKNGKK